MKTNHTKGKWEIIKNHPVFEHSILIMTDFIKTGKSFDKGKMICRIDEIRGDSFTRLEPEEMEANAKLIAAAPEMLQNEKDNHDKMLAIHYALSSSGFDKEYAQQLLRDAMTKTLDVIKKATE